MAPATQVWEGAHPSFHHIVSWEAGIYLYNTSEQYDVAKYWQEKSNQGISLLASSIGHTSTEIETMIAQMNQLRSQSSNVQ
jgi:hypothetical protein